MTETAPTFEKPAGVVDDAALAYESGVEIKARSQWSYARMRFFRHKLAVVSLVVLSGFAFVAIFASWIAPYGYDVQNFSLISQPPTLKGFHIFGTDLLGRDYLSRVIYGIRTSLWVAVFVAVLSTVIGTALGSVAGYYGGQTDNLLMRFTDLILTLPGLAVLLVAAAYLGQGDSQVGPITLTQPVKVALILSFLFWTGLARIVRGVFLSLREKEFVEASRSLGASNTRIIVREILPNLAGPMIVYMTLLIPQTILYEAALSYLGLGVPQQIASWGGLLNDAQRFYDTAWFLMLFPGLMLVITTLAFNLLGDGLRDALDVRADR